MQSIDLVERRLESKHDLLERRVERVEKTVREIQEGLRKAERERLDRQMIAFVIALPVVTVVIVIVARIVSAGG